MFEKMTNGSVLFEKKPPLGSSEFFAQSDIVESSARASA
jgi:hypothetical protein